MRRGVHYPDPTLPPSPPPAAAAGSGGTDANKLVVSILMAIFLPCAGMTIIFMIYICLLWYTSRRARNIRTNSSGYRESVKPVAVKGLTETELERLPEVTAEELKKIGRTECAVCLEEVENGQPARLLPGCSHGFHLPCADTWLSRNSVCPMCRAVIHPKLLDCTDDDNH